MINSELREACSARLKALAPDVGKHNVFVGLDGFVDEIVHLVDKRSDYEHFERIPTIEAFGRRVIEASGKSTNIEIVNHLVKLGGNGPIMGNALASFGLNVTYLGALGFPALHPVFEDFASRATVHSIAEAAHTDAFEFDDGKLLIGKLTSLNEINWDNIKQRFGRDKFRDTVRESSLVAFVNWTMIPYMSRIWESVLEDIAPETADPKKYFFFDLADPEKRTSKDIEEALGLIEKFESYYKVILGLNEKESQEIAEVLGINRASNTRESLMDLAMAIRSRVKVETVVVHPVTYALTASESGTNITEGPTTAKPKITTGAGDHFNSGFCVAKLLGLDNEMALLTGVFTSGFYVRTARSPSLLDLASMMNDPSI